MIDLHAHILHDLDDGPGTLEESLEMCRMAFRDGVRTIVATPHTLNGIYETDWSTILSRVHELNKALQECGMQHGGQKMVPCASEGSERRDPNSERKAPSICSALRTSHSELMILPGADVHFSSEIVPLCEKKVSGTINDKGKYMMVEFPHREIPLKAEDLFFRMLTQGVTPIISHPERNMEIRQRPQRYYRMIQMGCLGQVTAMSLTHGFGEGVRGFAEELVSHRLVHLIASDAHSIQERPPFLSSAVKAAGKLIGEDQALKMVTEYPQTVLDGRRPNIPEPIRI
jgi:protein-tyrosine phosphatase